MKRLAPSAARSKLAIHTDAVLSAETAIASAINAYPSAGGGAGGSGGMTGSGGAAGSGMAGTGGNADPTCVAMCSAPPPVPPDIMGMPDPARGVGNGFSDPRAKQDDAPIHQMVGQLHHPQSHKIITADTTASATFDGLNDTAKFLFNVHSWYFARHAENFAAWKNSVDGCGNNLLDFTCVPFLTEVRACGHERTNLPAMIIGGKQLGLVHDRFVTGNFTINRFWGTIAQAFGYTSTDAPFAAPLPDVWVKPPT